MLGRYIAVDCHNIMLWMEFGLCFLSERNREAVKEIGNAERNVIVLETLRVKQMGKG